ncbi:amino acid ABC transporter substrate-binding protein (PAAT family) [Krasilnikovia cinnamomea]|uniref:Amino acid ABC transporter substrate-binding protein (PAAT family) n=1 Tax=Krasilnikovia cinnamomea TaxID=349313 RepID=A0A4Q7ZU00_9ACTN|nr:ABC transporter substrate-binding protein [Krasilnikovia cinnamomea]RZU54361.1 amino acid ABC transporter substrate-binding protein (PAAT family) [Krasilnikovia cinnamomea]
MNNSSRRRGLVALGAALVLAAAGCAQPDAPAAGGDSPGVEFDKAIHDRLPADVKNKGALRFATDPSYAPMESYAPDGRTIVGFDADLAAALGAILGVSITLVQADFSTALDSAAAGKYDGVLSAMTDTAAREKKADFVNYFSAGTSIVVQRGNPKGVTDLKDLCGQVVAVEHTTVQEDLLKRSQAGCGDSPIEIKTFKTNADALMELRTGRAVAALNDFPPATQLANDQRTRAYYQLASTVQYEPGLYGIAIPKNQPLLRDALRDALDRLMRSGAYNDLLLRWGLSTGALQSSSINAGGSAAG